MEFFQIFGSVYFTPNADLFGFLQCQDKELTSQTLFLTLNLLTPWVNFHYDLCPKMRTHSNLLTSQCKTDFINNIITDIKLHFTSVSIMQCSLICFSFLFPFAKQIPVLHRGLDIIHKLCEWYVLICMSVDSMYWPNTSNETDKKYFQI